MRGPENRERRYTWSVWKTELSKRSGIPYEMEETSIGYTIWFRSGNELYLCYIWKGTVPSEVIAVGYSQSQNDTDLAEFEATYKSYANAPPSVSLNGLSKSVVYTRWTPNQNLTDEYTTVWQSSLNPRGIIIHDLLWRTNSDRVGFKISLNNEIVFEDDLFNLVSDFKTNTGDFPLSIKEYATNCWRFSPPYPLVTEHNGLLEVDMKATQGSNRSLVVGMTIWGKL